MENRGSRDVRMERVNFIFEMNDSVLKCKSIQFWLFSNAWKHIKRCDMTHLSRKVSYQCMFA